jgi:hypothetical protein
MKRFSFVLLIFLTACDRRHMPAVMNLLSGSKSTVPHNQVILSIGQSNEVRFEQYGEQAFLQAYANQNPGQVTFINCAVGGTSISQWQYQGQLMIQCDTHGLTPTAVFYWQGEADAANNMQNWTFLFGKAVAGWRKTFASPALPVVFAQLAVEDPSIYCPLENWRSIQDQQADVSIAGVEMIVTQDITQLDPDPAIAQGVHLSSQSYMNVASRYAAALLDLNNP